MTANFNTYIERRKSDCAKWDYYPDDVLPLWVADMDFRSPEPVIAALHDRVEHGVFGYQMDCPELQRRDRRALADASQHRHQRRGDPVHARFGLCRQHGQPRHRRAGIGHSGADARLSPLSARAQQQRPPAPNRAAGGDGRKRRAALRGRFRRAGSRRHAGDAPVHPLQSAQPGRAGVVRAPNWKASPSSACATT